MQTRAALCGRLCVVAAKRPRGGSQQCSEKGAKSWAQQQMCITKEPTIVGLSNCELGNMASTPKHQPLGNQALGSGRQPNKARSANQSNNAGQCRWQKERTSVLLQPIPWAGQANGPGRSANWCSAGQWSKDATMVANLTTKRGETDSGIILVV